MHIGVACCTVVLEADRASSADGIIILSQNIPDPLVHVINESIFIGVLDPLQHKLSDLSVDASLDLFDLIIVETLD